MLLPKPQNSSRRPAAGQEGRNGRRQVFSPSQQKGVAEDQGHVPAADARSELERDLITLNQITL